MVGKLFLISAPSGAGKTSLVSAVIERISSTQSIQRLVTYTTKSPRPGETPGVDYHYITVLEFEQKISEGFFLEYSGVYEHYYGTPRNVLDQIATGLSYIVIIDRIGAEKIMAHYTQAIPIWIYTKNIAVLHDRLLKRGTDSPEVIERRLKRAEQELKLENNNRLYAHHILNDDFNVAYNELCAIINDNI